MMVIQSFLIISQSIGCASPILEYKTLFPIDSFFKARQTIIDFSFPDHIHLIENKYIPPTNNTRRITVCFHAEDSFF